VSPTRTTIPQPRNGTTVRRAPRPRRSVERLDPGLRRDLRRVLTLLALTPLLFVLANETPRLLDDPLATAYGALVLSVTIALLYIAYAHYDDPSVQEVTHRPRDRSTFPPLPTDPTVSLLLAVRNEVDAISDCIRSVVSSDYPQLELVVVDDASTDDTGAILDDLAAELDFTVIHLTENVGKKRALVRAAELAGGDIIAFTDSDCVLAPDALSRCVSALVRHPELGAVSGHARAWNASQTLLTRIQDAWYEGQFRVAKGAESTFGTVTCVSGPLAVFRRDAILNYLPAWAADRFLGGEFRFATDRQLTAYVLGQCWIGAKLKRRHAGSPFLAVDYQARPWRVGYVQSARVWTEVPARLRPFLRQQVRWKKSFVRNLFFTGIFMWRRGTGPALMYYGHALWVAVAPFMAVRHLVWAPLHGLWLLSLLYLGGILLKGTAWAVAAKIDEPRSSAWRYRPLMSLVSALVLSWLLPYAILTIRRGVWARGSR
jgi:cellulose synthase/poly-beta-1,6-N-acetylglucosamine synthase-like glycosyltransferase